MALEIERKFLVDHDAWEKVDRPVGVPFRQGYIVKDELKVVRVRITPDSGFITIKGESKGAVRSEFEYSIPREDANELLELFCSYEVAKRRYFMPFRAKTWEVDVFEGKNSGLIVARDRIEFSG